MRSGIAWTSGFAGLAALVLAWGAVAACADAAEDDSKNNPNGDCKPGEVCDGGTLPDGAPFPDDKCDDTTDPTPVTTHPRLWVREADLPRLRSWAVDENPMWRDGIAQTVARAKQDFAKITAEDSGRAYDYTPYATEDYAMLFAFLSMVDPDEATRKDYATRARQLLMFVIDKAALGPGSGPFREKNFSTSNRSRWHGEGFPLTVDWIYGSLSADDKAKIRKVFLRWAEENENADITEANHPEPKGLKNDPRLVADLTRVYWASNNYFNAHLRNLTLMSLAFDEADDPGGELRKYLESATGAWLYTSDYLFRTHLRGGLGGEGYEYSPQSHGYVVQALLALHTAGMDSPKRLGRQVKLTCNPHYENSVQAFLHGLAPSAAKLSDPTYDYMGPIYKVAWYGDGEKSAWGPDFMQMFGPLGVYDQYTGNNERLAKLRWIETNAPPGGKEKMGERARARDFMIDPIMYFMLFDPAAAEPADPRPQLPLYYFDIGLNHLFARTDWTPNASWFTFQNGWSKIDHQHGDGLQFQYWRKGEWLTKERSGYGVNIGSSDYHNTLALQNDAPGHNDEGNYTNINWKRGSQWIHVNDGGGKMLAQSNNPKYTYALGDATTLYTSTYEEATDVTHASRSIVWLAPDTIVTYDRASTKKANRFKRFWMCLPGNATVANRVMTMTSPKGQKLFVSSLLPAAATVTVEAAENPLNDEPGEADDIKMRLRVEATGGPQSVKFLHVIKGTDAGGAPAATSVINSTGGTAYEGAAVDGVALMFPVDIAAKFESVTYTAPGGVNAHLVTGLAPDTGYKVEQNGGTVTVTPGGDKKTDSGGVLVIGTLP